MTAHVCLPTHPPPAPHSLPSIAEVSAVVSPRSVARRQQIIRDGFILITFSLIFFYRHAATPRWLRNIPQVVPLWAQASAQSGEARYTDVHLQSLHLCN